MTRKDFLNNFANWDNHRALLWPALEATSGIVLELGCGDGSTPYLHRYCEEKGRMLYSYDYDLNWSEKFKHFLSPNHSIGWITDWDLVSEAHPSPDVVLVDHSPGERRYIDIERFANKAKILVIHDSEPAATGYMLAKIWHLFKYRIDYKTEGAWATAVSNFIDVSKWVL